MEHLHTYSLIYLCMYKYGYIESEKGEKSLFFALVGALSIIKVVMIFCVCMIKKLCFWIVNMEEKGRAHVLCATTIISWTFQKPCAADDALYTNNENENEKGFITMTCVSFFTLIPHCLTFFTTMIYYTMYTPKNNYKIDYNFILLSKND